MFGAREELSFSKSYPKNPMKLFKIILGLLAIFALSACNHGPKAPEPGNYTVTQIDGKAVALAQPIRATYEDGRLSGKGPVNNWSLPVGEDGNLGVGISTRMAGPPELMDLETQLLKALDGGTLQAAKDGLVVMKDGKTVVVLVFAKP